jgi:broad specificity phosphatase PhoE
MLPHKEFYFLRHGETDWNKQGIYTGSNDIPLNETGLKQAERASEILKDYPIKSICISPMWRVRQTARFTIDLFGHVPQAIDDLREVCVGELEG